MPTTNPKDRVLGVLRPVGGGDPIPLLKPEMVVGRRRSCDICLDFNNISGRHCQLRLINSVWHVRDLGSTNGTSLNGLQLSSEHTVMPDDELAIASHLYTIDYEPGGPEAVLLKHDIIEEVEEPRRHSLLELAGFETDDRKPRHRSSRPEKAPASAERPVAQEPGFHDDIPHNFQAGPAPIANADDDDFLKFIEEDVKKASKGPENRK